MYSNKKRKNPGTEPWDFTLYKSGRSGGTRILKKSDQSGGRKIRRGKGAVQEIKYRKGFKVEGVIICVKCFR